MMQDGQCGMSLGLGLGLGSGMSMSMATSALDHGMHGPYTQNSLGFGTSIPFILPIVVEENLKAGR